MDARTVLLIDADPDSLNIYSLVLEHHGFRVLRASEGDAGCEMACDQQPSLVIAEPYTRCASGSTVVDQLRGDPRTARIPVVLLTAVPSLLGAGGEGESRPRGRLLKPCHPYRLLTEVRRVLSLPVSAAS